MLNPAIGELIQEYDSRYQLVLDVAKRARRIAEQAEEEQRIITDKPVSLAIDQIAQSKREKPDA